MTAEGIERLLAEAARDFHSGTEAKASGEHALARQHFLQAAEKLMLVAGKSQGRLQEMLACQGVFAARLRLCSRVKIAGGFCQ